MPVNRPSRRALTVATALATALASAPLLGFAQGATPGVTPYDIPNRTIGPNAGFPGNALYPESIDQGVQGRAPLAVITADAGVTIQQAQLRLFGTVNSFNDFEAGTGFQLYKDTDGDGKFRRADFDAGLVSSGFTVDFPTGQTFSLVTVTGTAGATGAETYFLTAHANDVSDINRKFTAQVPANGIVTSGDDFPASNVDIPEITIDSQPPAAPSTASSTNWLVTQNAPGSGETPVEDYYTVANEAQPATETVKKLVFFNDPNDTGLNSVLIRPPAAGFETGVPAIYDAPGATATRLYVGNGTGRTNTSPTAANNQKSDVVYVRSFDAIGNMAPPIGSPAVALGPGTVNRSNDVTAPTYTTYSVSLPSSINSSTGSTVTVTGSLAGVPSSTDVAKQFARLFRSGEGGVPVSGTFTDWKESTTAPTATGSGTNWTVTASTPGNSITGYTEGTRIGAEAYAADTFGNVTATVATTAFPVKDTTQPSITKIGVIQDTGTPNTLDSGDKIHLSFSEPMDVASILDTNGVQQNCDTSAVPATSIPANCVNQRILATDPNASPQKGIFGTNPGFDWGPNAESATITVGSAPVAGPATNCQLNSNCARQIAVTDRVSLSVNVKDINQNPALATAVNFSNELGLLPMHAVTSDSGAFDRFATGSARDGVIDAVTVTLNGALVGGVADAQDSFVLRSGGDSIVPTVNAVSGSADKVRLTFTPAEANRALWQTGARPVVELREVKTTGCAGAPPCTGLKAGTGGSIDVGGFTITSDDAAPPAVLSVRTADTSRNGKIDRLVVQYSEAIANQNPCGYTAAPTSYNIAPPSTNPTQCGLTANTRARISATQPDPTQTVLEVTEQASFDTGPNPAVKLSYSQVDATPPTSTNKPIVDAAGNQLVSWNNTTTGTDPTIDGAGPVVIERRTQDTDADGEVDQINVKFSETIAGPTVGSAQFTVTNPVHSVTALTLVDGQTIGVQVNENASAGTGDTGIMPSVQYQPGTGTGVTDINTTGGPNPAPAEPAGVASVDGAPPAIISESFNHNTGQTDKPGATVPADNGLKMKVIFSEVVTGTPDKTKFELTQGARTPAAPTDIAASTTTERIFTFAGPAYDLFAAGTLRMTAQGVLSDNASPANTSRQTAAVPYFGYPTAKLDLTGPAGSKPGYSTSRTINTGAAGNASVVKWLLVVQPASNVAPPPPTDPDGTGPLTPADDPRFVETLPATYTVETDDEYKAWLWTRDAVGNITHQDGQTSGAPLAEDSIRVAATAPTITGERMVNLQHPTTATPPRVRDGDTVRVLATANSTDAAQWSPGCPAAHMSVDYRGITGNSSKGTIAPTACDLKSSPARRDMEFPFVTVSKTTHYPIGTVLRSEGASEPGWILEDSASGVVRRKFFSHTARRTWMIPDKSVITVTREVLRKYPIGPVKSYRDGALIRAYGSTTTWMIDWGRKRAVPGKYIMYYKFNRTHLTYVNASEINAVPRYINITGKNHPFGTYVSHTVSGVTTYYVVLRSPNGRLHRREVANLNAVRTHIPAHYLVAANGSDLGLPLDGYVRGYRDGVLLSSGGKYYAVSRGKAREFASADIFNPTTGLGYTASHAIAKDDAALGHPRGELPSAGPAIDYTSVSVPISVRNVAGLETVKAFLVRALGVFEPVPTWLGTAVPPRP